MADSGPLAGKHRKKVYYGSTLFGVQREAGMNVARQQKYAGTKQMFLVVQGTPNLIT